MTGFAVRLQSLRLTDDWSQQLMFIRALLENHAEAKHGTGRDARRCRGEAVRRLGSIETYAIFRAQTVRLTSTQRRDLLGTLIEAGFPACIIQRITGHARRTIARHAGELGFPLPDWRWGRAEPEQVRFDQRRRGMR
jgi:hypothetical protein